MHPKYQFIEVVVERGKPHAKIDILIASLFGFKKFDTKILDKEICHKILQDVNLESGTNAVGAEYAAHNDNQLRAALRTIYEWEMANQSKPGCDM